VYRQDGISVRVVSETFHRISMIAEASNPRATFAESTNPSIGTVTLNSDPARWTTAKILAVVGPKDASGARTAGQSKDARSASPSAGGLGSGFIIAKNADMITRFSRAKDSVLGIRCS